MIKHITTDEVRLMTDSEGLILQGCGGDAQEWLDGINQMLSEEGILQNGGMFTDISVFQHDGLTNILFPLDGMQPGTIDMGKLAVWRLQSHGTFGGTWLSDYLPNRLGVDMEAATEKVSVLEKIQEARAAKATPQPLPAKERGIHKDNDELEV